VRRASVTVTAALALALTASAPAAWQSSGIGNGAAKSRTMPAGNTPSGSASGTRVTLTWAASNFAGGVAVPGYVIKRYDMLGNLQTTGANCSGIVSGTSCVETAPIGTWQYTVTPAAGSWRGTESAHSASVLVTGI
jgi:hypothetical protein